MLCPRFHFGERKGAKKSRSLHSTTYHIWLLSPIELSPTRNLGFLRMGDLIMDRESLEASLEGGRDAPKTDFWISGVCPNWMLPPLSCNESAAMFFMGGWSDFIVALLLLSSLSSPSFRSVILMLSKLEKVRCCWWESPAATGGGAFIATDSLMLSLAVVVVV